MDLPPITIDPKGGVLKWKSPKIVDGENDEVEITVTGTDKSIKTKYYSDYFELSVDQAKFPAKKAKLYKISVTLRDD